MRHRDLSGSHVRTLRAHSIILEEPRGILEAPGGTQRHPAGRLMELPRSYVTLRYTHQQNIGVINNIERNGLGAGRSGTTG